MSKSSTFLGGFPDGSGLPITGAPQFSGVVGSTGDNDPWGRMSIGAGGGSGVGANVTGFSISGPGAGLGFRNGALSPSGFSRCSSKVPWPELLRGSSSGVEPSDCLNAEGTQHPVWFGWNRTFMHSLMGTF